MSSSADVKPIMERLKESTAKMHDAAESSNFQAYLTQGKLPQSVYADYLEQLYLIHRKLEEGIAGSQFPHIVSKEQYQQDFLEKDLKHFGRDASSVKALSSTQKLLDEIAGCQKNAPVALLGMHYVLLGSKHGGKFVAKNCQDAYKCGEDGTIYFDPYGSNFMPIWKSFKESMNALELSESDSAALCKAASQMFESVGEIGAELMPRARA